ncbi:MAG: penicillin-binding protein, partial [Solirubrobacterales bacterium]|nr:penicillin-binding protein [Solirubrobacterales bacterium]
MRVDEDTLSNGRAAPSKRSGGPSNGRGSATRRPRASGGGSNGGGSNGGGPNGGGRGGGDGDGDGGRGRVLHLPLPHRYRSKPRLRKARVSLIVIGFLAIAGIASVFGMLTAVASDLPQLENRQEFKASVDSYLYDSQGQPIGVLAPPNARRIDSYKQISQNMVHAIISVEDKRFWHDPGVDLRGLLRAGLADFSGGSRQGGSTIAEEFVKNVLSQENNRTVMEKLREAALAFQLVHRWPRTKIMDEYLNAIYFGNGAYGVESAARTYFGWNHGYNPAAPAQEPPTACGDPDAQTPKRPECADVLTPAESALLAGMVANPYAFDPILHPVAAKHRRDQVLQDMLAQHYLTRAQFDQANATPLPTKKQIEQPAEPAAAPYFTSWVRPQIVKSLEREGVSPRNAQYEAYYGGLKIKLSLDLKLQQAAQKAVDSISMGGPTASLVSIDNKTGQVQAMVSGNHPYAKDPFNLATFGYRQPGSAFKVFTLAKALSSGKFGPSSTFDSKPLNIKFSNGGKNDVFHVHNVESEYLGPETLSEATAKSDNSVFTQLGLKVGINKIANEAKAMGVRTPISTNPAMLIGGLSHGISPLDLTHAYETLATGGDKVYNPILGDSDEGPIGIQSIQHCRLCDQTNISNKPTYKRIVAAPVVATIHQMLEGVVQPGGTATNAAIPGVDVVGKTGTTSNYVDAWFCGFTSKLTTCVWVGYDKNAKQMAHNYGGKPVEGGTYPALIWRNYVESALNILQQEGTKGSSSGAETGTTTVPEITPSSSASGGYASTGVSGGSADSSTASGAQSSGASSSGSSSSGISSAGSSSAGTSSSSGTSGATGASSGATGATGGQAQTPAA